MDALLCEPGAAIEASGSGRRDGGEPARDVEDRSLLERQRSAQLDGMSQRVRDRRESACRRSWIARHRDPAGDCAEACGERIVAQLRDAVQRPDRTRDHRHRDDQPQPGAQRSRPGGGAHGDERAPDEPGASRLGHRRQRQADRGCRCGHQHDSIRARGAHAGSRGELGRSRSRCRARRACGSRRGSRGTGRSAARATGRSHRACRAARPSRS